MLESNPGDATVQVLINRGNGLFNPSVSHFIGLNPQAAAIADVNADGKADVVAGLASNGLNSGIVMLGLGNGNFVVPTSYVTPGNPRGVAAGDVTGDGYPDMVVASQNTPFSVTVYTNAGNGTFGVGASLVVSAEPESVALADLNGDGLLDIITAFIASPGGLAVRLGLGGAAFSTETRYAAGSTNSYGVGVGDFNADGILDLATADGAAGSNTVSVLIAAAGGGFAAPTSYAVGTNSIPLDIAVSDVNSDGAEDLVAALNNGNQFGVLLGVGDGTFGSATTFTPAGNTTKIHSLALADFNLDGFTDVFTAAVNGSTVAVNTGTGTGSFNAGASYNAQGNPQFTVAADLNGDGLPDTISALISQSAVSIYNGAGNATFSNAFYVALGGPFIPVAADFNKDGHMDFALTNFSTGTVSVYLYTGCP